MRRSQSTSVAQPLMERLIDQGEEPFVIGELGAA